MSERATHEHVGDAPAGPSSHEPRKNYSRPAEAGLTLIFSDVVQPIQALNRLPIAYVADAENELPTRPLTAFFSPRYRVPANEVFDALKDAGVNSSDISCVQRQSSGEIVLTFRNAQFRENFLQKNVIKLRDQSFALQDVDRPLTYLQVFDVPHEMPDPTIINRLSRFCDVLHIRRGYFKQPGWENVQDGVRHYRVRIKSPIPNFIHFGRILFHFKYEGQPRTCRHCHQTGHFANACHLIICYNCDQTGHLVSECPEQLLCNFCKSPDHKAHSCPFSWTRETDNAHTENPVQATIDNNNDTTPPIEVPAPEEILPPPEESSPPTSGEPLCPETGHSYHDDDDFKSISDDTDSENDLTMDLTKTHQVLNLSNLPCKYENLVKSLTPSSRNEDPLNRPLSPENLFLRN